MKKFLIFLPVLSLFFLVLNSQRSVIGSTGYAGPEICKGCHEDRYESYIKTSHGIKADPRTPAAKQGCESCHGPGAAHVNAGGGKGVGGIIPLSPKSPTKTEKKNATCLECHSKGKVSMWDGGKHESKGLSCTNCH
ncbi:MAG: multiheme c-type cytochrome, partial [Nitrospirota bacterium]